MADGDLLTPRHAPARDLFHDVWAALPNRVLSLGHFGPYTVTRPEEAPDFRFERNGFGVWIEGVTANPSAKPPEQMATDGADETEVRFHEMNNVTPIHHQLRNEQLRAAPTAWLVLHHDLDVASEQDQESHETI